MEILISGKFSKDVFDDAYEITRSLRESFKSDSFLSLKGNIKTIALYPVILSPDLSINARSSHRFSVKEDCEIINIVIDHNVWMVGAMSDKKNLLISHVVDEIDKIRSDRVSDSVKSEIKSALVTLMNGPH